jgi:hypothetical protein
VVLRQRDDNLSVAQEPLPPMPEDMRKLVEEA